MLIYPADILNDYHMLDILCHECMVNIENEHHDE
jgi:hypothetical protein